MANADLEASWDRTRAHLRRALDAFESAGGDAEAKSTAIDLLDHNELELSADVLAEAADPLNDPALWEALASAAREMKLFDRSHMWSMKAGR